MVCEKRRVFLDSLQLGISIDFQWGGAAAALQAGRKTGKQIYPLQVGGGSGPKGNTFHTLLTHTRSGYLTNIIPYQYEAIEAKGISLHMHSICALILFTNQFLVKNIYFLVLP